MPNQRFSLVTLMLLSLFALPAVSDTPKKPEPGGEKPRDPAFAAVNEVEGLPRVLLIGDSISIGYTVPVRTALAGKANVLRNPGNGETSRNGAAKVEQWVSDKKWNVIHFNFGLHDIKVMPDGKNQVGIEDYEKNLREVVAKLKKTGAKLIFATTTPVPEGKLNPTRVPAEVVKYNEVAVKVMKEEGVAVDDLFALANPKLKEIQQPANVHFTKAGSKVLGDEVARSIESAIK